MEHIIQFVRPNDPEELAPCPFCGNKEIVYEQYEREVGIRWRVVCCGCMGMIDPGYAQNRYQVAVLWNRRSTL
jgi:predicted RNA-binding Zn-ribbon protein involved in translation (DUF1610 family)